MPFVMRSESELKVRLICFGGPCLKVDGKTVAVSTQQQNLLALFSAATFPRLPRQEVMNLLWRAGTEGLLRRRLNQLVYSLNNRLPDCRLLTTERETLTIKEPLWRDVDALVNDVRNGRLKRAIRILQRRFLPQLVQWPTSEFEEWLQLQHRQVRGAVRKAAAQRWADAQGRAEMTDALDAARLLAILDPKDESALRRLMESLLRAGRPEEAEAAARSFEEMMGVGEQAPYVLERETRDLVSRLKEPSIAWSLRNNSSEPRLIGRERELRFLRDGLRHLHADGPRAMLVTGEGGIGKTRLVNEVLLDAQVAGAWILRGRGAEMERGIPLNGLLQALGDEQVGRTIHLLEEPWLSVVLGLLPEFLQPDDSLRAPSIQQRHIPRRTFEALLRLIQLMAEERPVVFFLDDLQWADETSLTALRYIHQRWERGALLTVLACRTESIVPRSPLAVFLRTLRADTYLTEIGLTELAPDSAHALVQWVCAEAGEEIDPELIVRLAGGSPFFLIELALEWAAGRMTRTSDPPPHLSELPLSIRQLLDQRLRELSAAAQLLLDSLAVLAVPIEPWQLAPFTGMPHLATIEGVELLRRLHLIRTDKSGQVMLRHDLVQQEVYRRIDKVRRALLHGRAASVIQAATARPPVDQVAIHYDRAHDRRNALKYSLLAGTKAEEAGAVKEAIQYLRIANDNVEQPGDRAEITRRLGLLYYLSRDFERAPDFLRLAANRLSARDRGGAALSAEVKRLDILRHSEALNLEQTIAKLEEVKRRAHSGNHPKALVEALDLEIHLLARSGDTVGVRAVIEEASALADEAPPEVECAALCISALSTFYGCPAVAQQAAQRAVALAYKHEIRNVQLKAINCQLVVMLNDGTLNQPEGQRLFSQIAALSRKSGDLLACFYPEMNRGVWLTKCGAVEQATEAFERAGSIIRASTEVAARLFLTYNQGLLLTKAGHFEHAAKAFNSVMEQLTLSSGVQIQQLTCAGLGLCAIQGGKLSEALEWRDRIGPLPSVWHFNPSLIIAFQSRLLLAQNKPAAALDHVAAVAERLKPRLTTAWLELKLEECRVAARLSSQCAHERAVEPRRKAEQLGIAGMVRGFSRYCS